MRSRVCGIEQGDMLAVESRHRGASATLPTVGWRADPATDAVPLARSRRAARKPSAPGSRHRDQHSQPLVIDHPRLTWPQFVMQPSDPPFDKGPTPLPKSPCPISLRNRRFPLPAGIGNSGAGTPASSPTSSIWRLPSCRTRSRGRTCRFNGFTSHRLVAAGTVCNRGRRSRAIFPVDA